MTLWRLSRQFNFYSAKEKKYIPTKTRLKKNGRTIEKVCPPVLEPEHIEQLKSLAIASFKALGCSDSARVDFRMDRLGNIYILEINSMASLGLGGSYVYAAEK